MEAQTKDLARKDGLQQGRLESLEGSITERLKLLAALEPPERERLAANWRRFGRVPYILDVLAVHTALTTGVEPDVQAQLGQRLEFTDP